MIIPLSWFVFVIISLPLQGDAGMPWAYHNLNELVQMKENRNKDDFLWVEIFSHNYDVKWLTRWLHAAALILLIKKKVSWTRCDKIILKKL